MKNKISTTEQLIPLRTRQREEREMVRGLDDLDNDFTCRFLPRHGAYIFVIPHGNGSKSYTSTSFDLPAAEKLAEFFFSTIPDAEELPAVRGMLDHLEWEHRRQIERIEGELQVLRWRVLHLEREAERRLPAYTDATALVLVKGGAL